MGIAFQPLVFRVRSERFFRRWVATGVERLEGGLFVGEWPRCRTARRRRAFGDSIALVV